MTTLPSREGAADVMTSRHGDADEFEAELGPLLTEAVRLATGMLLNAVEAEDAVQDACVRAWRSRANRRPGSPLRPWFLGIVANQCREARRARWWQVLRIAEPSVSSPAKRDDLSAQSDLRDALSRLPYRRRLAIVLRYYLVQGFTRQNIAAGLASCACVGLLFLSAQFWGTMAVPEAEFVRYLQGRMADPTKTNFLSFSYIWYQPLSREIHDTWERMPSNILGVPVFALLIWLHTPLWRHFADLIRSLSDEIHRRVVIAAIVTVSCAYLVMFAMVFDYSRWISNWAVCMFLILHAVKTLPASKQVALISADDRKTNVLGWIITLIPRVGIVRPF